VIRLVSFAFRDGAPAGPDLVLDCRRVRNPYRVPALRERTGLDPLVQEWVAPDREARRLHAEITAAACSGRRVACGCHGGRHRSVAIVELAARELRRLGRAVEVLHLGLMQDGCRSTHTKEGGVHVTGMISCTAQEGSHE
jgi:UPF0042 nucleotide-binding protein